MWLLVSDWLGTPALNNNSNPKSKLLSAFWKFLRIYSSSESETFNTQSCVRTSKVSFALLKKPTVQLRCDFFILFYVYYSLPFKYCFSKYLSPCFSCILCFCVNFVSNSFQLIGSMACLFHLFLYWFFFCDIIVLQPLHYSVATSVIHHEWDLREE